MSGLRVYAGWRRAAAPAAQTDNGPPGEATDGRAARAGTPALAALAAAACLAASACAASPPPDESAGASSTASTAPPSSAPAPSASPDAASSTSSTADVASPTANAASAATPASTSAATAPSSTAAASTLPPPRVLTVEVILTDLENPRGVGLDAQGGLMVAEAGYGEDAEAPILRTGRLTRFLDLDGDGSYGGEGEAERWLDNMFSFNSVNKYETGRDEVSGPTDVLVHEDGRVYLSLDGGIDQSGGHFVLFELDWNGEVLREIPQHSNMTGIGFSPDGRSIYATQSTLNQLIEIDLETGQGRQVAAFDDLHSGQQAVPAGLAVSPDGGVLVALFSGVAKAEGEACRFVPEVMCDGRYLPLVPTDAKVVRVDPETGAVTDEVTGLTAAVDVAVDGGGNVFVVEMAADHAQLFHQGVDLFAHNLPALHGGYIRFSGKVTMHPPDGGEPRILAEGLDQPTNITAAPGGVLYVSTGQGTPGRPIPGPEGSTVVIGEVIRITGY